MSLSPAQISFIVWKGATFRKRLTLHTGDEDSPVRDLTDYTAVLTIENKPGGDTLLTLDELDGLVIGDDDGTIDIVIPAATTDTFTWKGGVFELKITSPGGDTDTLLYGSFKVRGF